MSPGLIVELEVRDRQVLVVGAGAVGRRRARRLISLGARLRWVAPNAPLGHIQRAFQPDDCDGVTLVVACAPPGINAAVVAAAEARHLPIIRADAGGVLRWLAVVERGPLQIALSTGGRAPAAARAIRRALESRVPPAWTDAVEQVARLRARWRDRADRTARLAAVIGGPLAPVIESGLPLDSAALERWIASVEATDRAMTTAEPAPWRADHPGPEGA